MPFAQKMHASVLSYSPVLPRQICLRICSGFDRFGAHEIFFFFKTAVLSDCKSLKIQVLWCVRKGSWMDPFHHDAAILLVHQPWILFVCVGVCVCVCVCVLSSALGTPWTKK